jgi:hypothetical protein
VDHRRNSSCRGRPSLSQAGNEFKQQDKGNLNHEN